MLVRIQQMETKSANRRRTQPRYPRPSHVTHYEIYDKTLCGAWYCWCAQTKTTPILMVQIRTPARREQHTYQANDRLKLRRPAPREAGTDPITAMKKIRKNSSSLEASSSSYWRPDDRRRKACSRSSQFCPEGLQRDDHF